MKNTKAICTLLAAGVTMSGAAQAALFDRGGGLLYDDVLKVTWLQDANYAKTSGYADANPDGTMNWGAANTWAANLVYHDSVRGTDWTGWRLARNSPVGGDWNDAISFDGSTDRGFNITSPNSELAYMYYVNLGLKSSYSPARDRQPDSGIHGDGTIGDQADVGLVKNLQPYAYWSGSAYAPHPADSAWLFATASGAQNYFTQGYALHAWAVRPGDVAAVPEPETYALFLGGLAFLGGTVRRRPRFGSFRGR